MRDAPPGFPGVLYYLSQWFPTEMRARAISRFYVAIPISNVLMGVVAGSLLKLPGKMGLKGWQWLFVVEALPAIVMGAVVFFILPEGPESAGWLEPEERTWLLRRLESEAPRGTKSFTGLFHALKDPRVLLFGIYFFLMLGLTYAFTFAAPTVFVGLTHWNVSRVGFVLAGISLLGAVSMVVVSHLSDLTGRRLAFVVPLTLATGLAFLVSALARGPHTAWIVIAAVSVANICYFGTTGVALSLVTSLLKGPPAAIAIAAVNTMGSVGGFVGPYLMGWSIVRWSTFRVGWGSFMLTCILAVVSIAAAVRGRSRGHITPRETLS